MAEVYSKRERHLVPSSAMYGAHGTFFRLLVAPRFARVMIDDRAVEQIRDASERGTVVYAMRHASTLDFLFFNWLYGKLGLPLARFVNRIHPVLWMPLGRLLGGLIRRQRGGMVARCGGLVTAGYSLLLFLKNPPGKHKKRLDSLDYVTELVRRQRELTRPILIVPQMLLEKEPYRLRGGRMDRLFGHRPRLSRWRQLMRFWWRPTQARAVLGEIVDLKEELSTSAGLSDEEIARRVRRKVLGSLAAERRVVLGPAVKPQSRMNDSILAGRDFRDRVAKIAEQEGKTVDALRKRARKLLDEIAADFHVSMIRFMSFVLYHLAWKRMYGGHDGFVLDDEQVQRVRELARTTPLILMPCHKSHLDYLLISYIMFHRDMIPPHIAAGVNLSFWPLGFMFRRAGAFFLRRTFRGDPLYAMVFRGYIKQLFREGFSIEFFVEGTRSRTGKLLSPKLGILTMLVEAFGELKGREVAIVPISLSYEDVAEDTAYTSELLGGEKTKEDLTGFAKSTKVLAKEFGKVFIRFAEPIKLSTYWRDCAAAGRDPLDRKSLESLAHRVLHQINLETAATPSALVATSLLTHGGTAMTQAEVVGDVEYLAAALSKSGMPLAPRLQNPVAAFIDVRNRFLGKGLVGLQQQGDEALVTIDDRRRIQLDYYKNNALIWLVPRSMVALSVLAGPTPISRGEVRKRVRWLSGVLREDFIYPPREDFELHFFGGVEALIEEGLLEETADGLIVVESGVERLHFNANLLANFIEGYRAALQAAAELPAEALDEREVPKRLQATVRRAFLEGRLRRSEVLSKSLFQNVTQALRARGILLLDLETKPSGKAVRRLKLDNGGAERARVLAKELTRYELEGRAAE